MKRRLNAAMRVWTRASLFGHPHLTGLLRAPRATQPPRRPAAFMKLRRFIRSARSLRHTTGHAGAFSAFFLL
jgi:hypothetical protein